MIATVFGTLPLCLTDSTLFDKGHITTPNPSLEQEGREENFLFVYLYLFVFGKPMDILGKLFGSESKVKIMRLFLFNPELSFTNEDVAERSKSSFASTRHELSILRKMKFIKSRTFIRSISKKRAGKEKITRKKVWGWGLNASFSYLHALEHLLIDSGVLKGEEVVKKLNSSGRLKLVMVAGIFIQDPDSRVDIFVVGDHLRRSTLETAIKNIEAEVGRELKYAAFDTAEFTYRLGMYDKLVRDILDYPHKTVLDRLGVDRTAEA